MYLTKLVKILLFIVLMSLCFSRSAHANSEINSGKLINSLSNRIMEVLVSSARTKAEISYDSVNYNPTLGLMTLNNLQVAPFARQAENGCLVSVGSIGFTFYREGFSSRDNVGAELIDVNIRPPCLPIAFRGGLAIAGIRELNFPALRLELSHHYPSSGTTVTLIGSLNGAAAISANAEFSYLSFIDNKDLPFFAQLKSLELSIDNNGLWENIVPQLPPSFTTPGLASATLTEAITNSLDNHVSSSTIQEILVASSPAIDSFLSNPNSLTFRSQIPAQKQLVVEFEIFQNIELFLASLRPILIANDKRGLPQLSLEKLKLAINGDIQSLSDSELLSYSRLFIEGKQIPKNTKLARGMLANLAEKDFPDAIRMLVELEINDHNFKEAYYNAIKLSEYEGTYSSGLINRLEGELPFETVIAIQNDFLSKILETPIQKKTRYFEKAHSHLNGSGATKSYLGAYFFALLAKANGDVGADLIISKVEKISSDLSGTDRENWLKQIVSVQSIATSKWMELQ